MYMSTYVYNMLKFIAHMYTPMNVRNSDSHQNDMLYVCISIFCLCVTADVKKVMTNYRVGSNILVH